jgi:hypothetical protein
MTIARPVAPVNTHTWRHPIGVLTPMGACAGILGNRTETRLTGNWPAASIGLLMVGRARGRPAFGRIDARTYEEMSHLLTGFELLAQQLAARSS